MAANHIEHGSARRDAIRRTMRVSAATIIAAAVAFLATSFEASASSVPKWPTNRVTYCDRTPWPTTVRRVVWRFNQLPVRLHLVRAACRRNADIVIDDTYRTDVDWVGLAQTTSYGRRIVSAKAWVNRSWSYHQDIDHRFDTLAHELMHALGVPHLSNACSVVATSGAFLARNCGAAPAGSVRCGPQYADVLALYRRFGSSGGQFGGTFCPTAYGFDGE